MSYNLEQQLEQEIITFAQIHGIKKLILFGSRARGDNGERSDIDLAVSGGNAFAFYNDIEEECRTLLMFDVVDLDSDISEDLRAEIARDGVILYEEN